MRLFSILLTLGFFATAATQADVEPTTTDTPSVPTTETTKSDSLTINMPEITKNDEKQVNYQETAEEPTVEKDRFTGFFIGINLGGLINASKAHIKPSGTYVEWSQAEQDARKYNMHFKNGGFTGGAQLGYQYQYKNFYCGLETDFDYSSLRKHVTVDRAATAPVLGNVTYTVKQKVKWYGTLRPKIGAAIDPVAIYATGGLVYGHIKSSTYLFYYGVDDDVYAGSRNKTQIGWTVGGGLGFLIADHWTINTDYLFVDLGKYRYVCPSNVAPTYSHTTTMKTKFHDIRVGFNYIF